MVESSLENLKKNYAKLQGKYKLPLFQEMNAVFDVEKVAEHETDCLLREIRKAVMDKVIAYLRFIEMLLNPSNAPIFFFALVKSLTLEDKRTLEEIYNKLGSFEIDVIELDCRYDEKKEAEFIKKMFIGWKSIEEKMLSMIKTLKRNWNQKSTKNHRAYFG